MSVFSLKKIAAYAESRQAYLRGVSLYGAGRVTHVTCTARPPYAALWQAEVFRPDDATAVQVCAGFDAQGALVMSGCTCAAGRSGHAACRHVVALLVHKYYADMLQLQTPAPAAPAHTDEPAAQLLQTYRLPEPAGNGQSLTLLLSAEPQPVAELLYGAGHPCRVRDWVAFCRRMETGETAGYGQGAPFRHDPSQILAADQPLLRGLSALARRREEHGIPSEQPLNEEEWELLLDWVASSGFVLRAGGNKRLPCRVCSGDPSLPLTVETAEGGILLQAPPYRILPGLCGMTLLYEQTLYRCSYAFTRQVGPFLQTLAETGFRQFWAEEDLPAFCDTVWLQIAPSILLQGNAAALLTYLPPNVAAEIYLEQPRPRCLTAEVFVRYGDQRVGLLDEQADLRRNRRQEQNLLGELNALFPLREGPCFAVQGDEAALDAFLADVLPVLQRLGTVFVAENGRTLPALRTQPAVQVGLHLNSGLLDLSVQAEGWDREALLAVWSSYRHRRAFHRLPNGQLIDLREGQLVRTLSLLEQSGVDDRTLTQAGRHLPSCRALLLQDRLNAGGIGWTADAAAEQLLQTVRDAAAEPPELSPALEPLLRAYQKQGVAFLQTLTRCGFGGILADDMGLGKTVQVLALLQAQKGPASGGTALVVCPASLILNWEHEAHKFTPDLRVRAIYGTATDRHTLLETEEPVDLLITSYDLLKRDLPYYQAKTLTAVILDEAQYIKNHNTQNAGAVKALQAPCRLALTGTPLENRLSELWSIFDFLMPGFLFSYAGFRERYERPIVRDHDEVAAERLHQHIAPFVLRRTKEEVLQELPPKTQTVRYAVASDAQMQLYRAQLLEARGRLHENAGKLEVLAALTRLRQLCCDPSLCYGDYTGGSAKLDCCMDLVQEAVDGGHKVLLFSQFTSMLQRIGERLRKVGCRYYLLQGDTPKPRRSEMVDAFNTDSTPVMLVSLKAGGTGLNLTGADVVIHYDPWWNAAAMDQATDRAHRIGQTKPVQVYTLLLKDTVEEKILLLQQTKRRLAGQIIPSGGGLLESVSREQLLALLQ